MTAPRKREIGRPFRARSTIDPNRVLTDQEMTFVLSLIGSCAWNGTAAARAAGVTEASARTRASEWLAMPAIANAITEAMAERAAKLKIDADFVLLHLVSLYHETVQLPKGVASIRLARDMLETIGRHVDVRAFRTQIGIANPMGGPVEEDISCLDDEELEWYGRIARKIEANRRLALPAGVGTEAD